MDASLTDDQLLLRSTAARLADELGTPGADALANAGGDGWDQLVQLGIPAMRSPAFMDVQPTGVELALVVEEFGRTLSRAPVVGQGVLVPELLSAAGAHEALDGVVAGELRLAPGLRADLSGLATVGHDAVAFDANGATHALLLEAVGPEPRLVAVALRETPSKGLDLTRALVPIEASSPMSDIGGLGGPISAGRMMSAEALVLTSLTADLVGVMEGALKDAVGYVTARRQFGVPVGTFQAVQHLAAEALVQVEGARSCCWYAAWAVDRRGPEEALLAARTAKAYSASAGIAVVEATVQLFGGVAITWEQLSHVRLRRALLDRQAWGDETVQYTEISATRLAHPELV